MTHLLRPNLTWLVGMLALALPACGKTPRHPVHHRFATPRLRAHAELVLDAFDAERALATVAYVERYFRVRGNEGYQKSLERVVEELRRGGFEDDTLRTLELGPRRPTWTPRAARLSLGSEALVAFSNEAERDRACLLVGSDPVEPSTIQLLRAEAVRSGADAHGRIVLAEGEPGPLFEELVVGTGAAGIIVRNLEGYHQPERFPDAAQFGYLPAHEGTAFGFSVSDRVWRRLREATSGGPVEVAVEVRVVRSESAATAVEARIPGTDPEAGAIVFVAHADEPGANDNASGVAALAELAVALRRSIAGGALARPRRTLVFLWGQEIEVSRAWLAAPPLPVAAGLVMDMVGEDPDAVGAPFLIERMPNPGAVWLRAPDRHSEWGASEVDPARLRGHFLSALTEAAAAEVAQLAGPWRFRSHPFEGGSDHVSFLSRGLPAVLAWHFTDSAYHTTLDRLDRVSGREMQRVAATLGAVALTMASGDDADVAELVDILARAERSRLASLREASAALIRAGRSSASEEARVREAWLRWYEQAWRSIVAWAPGSAAGVEAAHAAPRPTP